MHLRELVHQPVNLAISIVFVLSFGLVATSLMLKGAGLPDPITDAGEYLGGKLLDSMFGPIIFPQDNYKRPIDMKCRC